jgi:tryptophanyl-tRNA synthetase
MAPGSEMDSILATGAERARARARVVLDGVRRAVGIDGV